MSAIFRFALLALLIVSVAACDSTGEDTVADTVLYVGNAGNFSDENGSVTRYDLETETVTQDAVPNLGGLVQNLYGGANTLYVVLNFSDSFSAGTGRIDIVDVITGQRTRQYDVDAPRGFAASGTPTSAVEPGEVLVSNLAGTVTPLNLSTGETGTPLPVGYAPEGVATVGGRTYVANAGFGSGTTLSVIDPVGYTLVDTIEDVCTGPRTLLGDRDSDLWVICTGNRDFATGAVTAPGEVVVLNGRTGAVTQRFTIEGETLGSATLGQDGTLVSTSDRDEIYVIGTGRLLRFDTRSNTATGSITVSGAPIGAVAYEPTEDFLYLARPNADNPYTVDGVVTIHDRMGTQIGQFPAGIAPLALTFATTRPVIEG